MEKKTMCTYMVDGKRVWGLRVLSLSRDCSLLDFFFGNTKKLRLIAFISVSIYSDLQNPHHIFSKGNKIHKFYTGDY